MIAYDIILQINLNVKAISKKKAFSIEIAGENTAHEIQSSCLYRRILKI